MKLEIEYLIESTTIANDKRVFKKSNISFENFQNEFSFSDFLEAFADSKILIKDRINQTNSLSFIGSLLGFCYNTYAGLIDLKNKKNIEFYSFGTEQGEYSLKFYLKNNFLIIERNNQKFQYEFNTFIKVFEAFMKKVVLELPIYYKGLETSPYFIRFQQLFE